MSKPLKEDNHFVPRSIKHKKKKKNRRMIFYISLIVVGGSLLFFFHPNLSSLLQTEKAIDTSQDFVSDSPDHEEEKRPTDNKESEVQEESDPTDENVEIEETKKAPKMEDDLLVTNSSRSNDKQTVTSSPSRPTREQKKDTTNQQINKQPNVEKIVEIDPDIVIIHEVKPNETLFSITKKYYLNLEKLHTIAQFNNISNPSTDIKAGLLLKLPDPDLLAIHEVKPDETLFSIAMNYYENADVVAFLAAYNNIDDPAIELQQGLTLYIPHLSLLHDGPDPL